MKAEMNQIFGSWQTARHMTWDGFKNWYERAGRVIDSRDLLLLTPVGVVAALLKLARQRVVGDTEQPTPQDSPSTLPADLTEDELHACDIELVDVFADLFRALGRYYFRLRVEGLESFPVKGPALLVGNHNGGVLPLDSLFTGLAVYDHSKRFGPPRVVRGLGHDSLFAQPVIGRYARRLGIVPARPKTAERLLREGELALVYPGSDWDAGRTFSERHRICLAGRRGFLRLALRTGVPIVPVVSVGTHEQLIILSRGEWLARTLRLHKLTRTDTFPLALSLPWGFNSALLPYLPLPAQTTLLFGEPLRFADISPEQSDDEEVLGSCYSIVEERMQSMLDRLSRDRIPFLGRL